jgi:hypothetical protein
MTAAQDEGWIQGSLARLETLEAQRKQLAARGPSPALAEVEEEIKALYEVLESAAGEGQAPANTGMAPGMGMAPAPGMGVAPPIGMAPAPMSVAPPIGMAPAPMGMAPPPIGMAPPPMGMASGPGMVMEPMPSTTSLEMLDEAKGRNPMPFIIGGVVAVVLAIGGIVAMSGNDKDAKPAPTEPAKEIKAGAISADTQEPVVAKGADADRTAGTKYREPPPEERDARRPSSGNSNWSRPRSKKEEDDRKLTVEKSRDPLAGID